MYLSYLMVDTAASGPAPGRKWIANSYSMHQRLCMAFPSDSRKSRDGQFLEPFLPSEFTSVHVHRGKGHGFLFRLDSIPASSPSRHVVTVQSGIEPDWNYAFQNAPEFLAARPIVKPFEPEFRPGQRLHFRLRANPVKRVAAKNVVLGPALAGKRVGLFAEADQLRWFLNKAERGGFRVPGQWDEHDGRTTPNFRIDANPEGRVHNGKPGHDGWFLAVRFEGVLEVTDPVAFRSLIEAGVGPAKGFGFGLLSVAPA